MAVREAKEESLVTARGRLKKLRKEEERDVMDDPPPRILFLIDRRDRLIRMITYSASRRERDEFLWQESSIWLTIGTHIRLPSESVSSSVPRRCREKPLPPAGVRRIEEVKAGCLQRDRSGRRTRVH